MTWVYTGGAWVDRPNPEEPSMLKAEKRHTQSCKASEYDRNVKKCKCPYRAIGMLNAVFVRKALKTSNEEEALRIIRRWEGEGQPDESKDRAPASIQLAVATYMDDTKARNLSDATRSKLKTIFEKQFLTF